MASNIIQIEYTEMESISREFAAQAERAEQIIENLEKHVQDLRGEWEGFGGQAFFDEFDTDIAPAFRRLSAALNGASTLSDQISATLRQVEEDSAGQIAAIDGNQPTNGGGGHPTAAGQPSGVNSPGFPGYLTPSADGVPSGGSGAETDTTHPGTGAFGLPGDFASQFNTSALISFQADTDGVDSEDGFEGGIELEFGDDGSSSVGRGPFGIFRDWEFFDDAVVKPGDPDNPANVNALGGRGGFGLGFGEDGFSLGPYGEVYLLDWQGDSVLAGDDDFGWTVDHGVRVGTLDGFAGYQDGNIGWSAGANLISVPLGTGVNVAGHNVGVEVEPGLKLELGGDIGRRGVNVKLPFISFGVSFGDAKD